MAAQLVVSRVVLSSTELVSYLVSYYHGLAIGGLFSDTVCDWLQNTTEGFYILRSDSLPTFTLLNNAVFWDVTPCGSCKNRRFGERICLHHQGEIISVLGTEFVDHHRGENLKSYISNVCLYLHLHNFLPSIMT
jgi:hypothetical protein